MGAMEGIFLDGLMGFVAGFVAGFVTAFVVGTLVVFFGLNASKERERLFESEEYSIRLESLQNFEIECVKVKVKLRFLAPSAGIAEVAKR